MGWKYGLLIKIKLIKYALLIKIKLIKSLRQRWNRAFPLPWSSFHILFLTLVLIELVVVVFLQEKKIDNSFILLAMGLLLVYSWSQMYTVQANVFPSPEHSGIPNIRRILTC